MGTIEWNKNNIDKLRKYRRDWYAKNKEHARSKIKDRRKYIRQWFKEIKSELKCKKCGEDDPCCIELHHRDPSEKDITLNEAVNKGWGKDRILRELAKCDPLCANCHRKLHFSKFFN